jgi:endonuclease YncB( thermonuclease family)
MTKPIPSHLANIALAAGVAAAMGIAIALTLTHAKHHPPVTRSDIGQRAYPADAASVSAPRVKAETGFSVTRLRAGVDTPFEPPPPPLEEAATASAPPAERQVAALPATADADVLTSAPALVLPNSRPDVAPRREPPPRHRVQTATREPVPPAAPGEADDNDEGVKLAGPAIVTGPLELNIDGKPLELYGVKPPTGEDVCSPGDGYAARDCRDVSRQALAARIGLDGDVTCRILAVGGRSSLPAVCTDGKGGDLATYLVAHGFALADPNEIVDYSGAEARAKNARSGLWTYR